MYAYMYIITHTRSHLLDVLYTYKFFTSIKRTPVQVRKELCDVMLCWVYTIPMLSFITVYVTITSPCVINTE